jgi:hypothetical protein
MIGGYMRANQRPELEERPDVWRRLTSTDALPERGGGVASVRTRAGVRRVAHGRAARRGDAWASAARTATCDHEMSESCFLRRKHNKRTARAVHEARRGNEGVDEEEREEKL